MSNQQIQELSTILSDKTIKAKAKTAHISDLLLQGMLTTDALIAATQTQKDSGKATLIEALEYATSQRADIIDSKAYEYVLQCLAEDAPRIKWEAAKVIANTTHLYPKLVKKAINGLLPNTSHEGKVVRWSAAGALATIMLLQTPINKELVPALQNIMEQEPENSIKKIYMQAMKQLK